MSQPAVLINSLSYADRLASREKNSIDLVVIHCTELPDLAMAREYGERIHHAGSRTGNSGHYYIERSGHTEQWVPPLKVAHHVRNFNVRSIGIELVNTGRFPNWFDSRHQTMKEPYTRPQLNSLLKLLLHLSSLFPTLRWIAGHETLDHAQVPASDKPGQLVYRKCDPGPLFPWNDLLPKLELELLPPDESSKTNIIP